MQDYLKAGWDLSGDGLKGNMNTSRMSFNFTLQAALVENEAAGLPPATSFGLGLMDLVKAGEMTDNEAIDRIKEYHKHKEWHKANNTSCK